MAASSYRIFILALQNTVKIFILANLFVGNNAEYAKEHKIAHHYKTNFYTQFLPSFLPLTVDKLLRKLGIEK